MGKLNFRQIEAFRAVMLTGTTIGAAQTLFTTQPSVSRLLHQLQSATGLKLFERERGRLRPTAEARSLLEAVQSSFLGLTHIEQAAARLRKSGTGVLRLACTPTLGLGVVPESIGRFRASHPEVHIGLHTVGSHQIRDGLLNGHFDVGLTTSRFHFQGPEFRTEVLHETQAVCVMGRRHPLAHRRTVSARHFQGETLLTLDAADDLAGEWQRTLAHSGIIPASVIETTYTATICALAAAGVGLGVVNPYTARVFADRLAIVRLTPKIAVRTLAAYPAHIPAQTLARDFVALLSARFRPAPRSSVSAG